MSKIKVATEVKVYEKDGKEVSISEDENITVHNHWNRREFVILNVNGQKVTVLSDHLKRAVDNATNQPMI